MSVSVSCFFSVLASLSQVFPLGIRQLSAILSPYSLLLATSVERGYFPTFSTSVVGLPLFGSDWLGLPLQPFSEAVMCPSPSP